MDKYERDLIRHLLAYLPYGRPDSTELFVEFGISTSRAQQLISEIARKDCAAYSLSDRQLIAQLANLRDVLLTGSEWSVSIPAR